MITIFTVNKDNSIFLTRGDVAVIEISTVDSKEQPYIFKTGDMIRFRIGEKNQFDMVVIQKDVIVKEEATSIDITLTKDDTKIGGLINRPVDYWYKIELNPDTDPQTIIGYDTDGPKVFAGFSACSIFPSAA